MRPRSLAGVWPSGVVELQLAAERVAGLRDRGDGVQVHLFILDRFPDALDENVVALAAPAMHADLDAFFI